LLFRFAIGELQLKLLSYYMTTTQVNIHCEFKKKHQLYCLFITSTNVGRFKKNSLTFGFNKKFIVGISESECKCQNLTLVTPPPLDQVSPKCARAITSSTFVRVQNFARISPACIAHSTQTFRCHEMLSDCRLFVCDVSVL